MTSHDLTLLGYGAFVAAGASLQVVSARSGGRVPSFGRLLAGAMRTRPGRVGVVVGWAWVGLHFLVR